MNWLYASVLFKLEDAEQELQKDYNKTIRTRLGGPIDLSRTFDATITIERAAKKAHIWPWLARFVVWWHRRQIRKKKLGIG